MQGYEQSILRNQVSIGNFRHPVPPENLNPNPFISPSEKSLQATDISG